MVWSARAPHPVQVIDTLPFSSIYRRQRSLMNSIVDMAPVTTRHGHYDVEENGYGTAEVLEPNQGHRRSPSSAGRP